jgi:hypothetical protein
VAWGSAASLIRRGPGPSARMRAGPHHAPSGSLTHLALITKQKEMPGAERIQSLTRQFTRYHFAEAR